MKKLKNFKQYITEAYEENPEFRIQQFFEELKKNINQWFSEGSLSQNSELVDIKISTLNAVEKNIMFDFLDDSEFYYQICIIIPLVAVGEEQLKDGFIKVKLYNQEEGKLLRTLSKDIEVKDINEDKILELISELKDKSGSVLDDSPDTLEEKDTELEKPEIK